MLDHHRFQQKQNTVVKSNDLNKVFKMWLSNPDFKKALHKYDNIFEKDVDKES